MVFQERVWRFVAVATLLLTGVPSNVAVIWIHTRKDSRVAKNKFPLIFAAIDLIALLLSLPLHASMSERYTLDMTCAVCEIQNGVAIFMVNGYLSTLLMATIDKFWAVMYPFKYGSSHKRFLNVALIFAFGVNFISAAVAKLEAFIVNRHFTWTVIAYNIALGLMFLAVIGLFVAIAVKLILNERKMRKVGPFAHRLVRYGTRKAKFYTCKAWASAGGSTGSNYPRPLQNLKIL